MLAAQAFGATNVSGVSDTRRREDDAGQFSINDRDALDFDARIER